jgi:DeoR/GlpR family transcriptional regulator of sugar metabolism
MRKTTSPTWEREIFVGNVNRFTLENVNIDEVVLGVKAVDKDGNESLVTAFTTPPYQQRKIETY